MLTPAENEPAEQCAPLDPQDREDRALVNAAVQRVMRERSLPPEQKINGMTPETEDQLKIFQPEQDFEPPKRLNDDIYRTVKGVRDALKEAGIDENTDGILIPMEKDYATDTDPQEIEVPRSLILALIATARVALRWKTTEKDPITPGIDFAEKMLAAMPLGRISLEDLQRNDNFFECLEPIRANEKLLESLETALKSIPENAPEPHQLRKQFYVEQRTDPRESTHVTGIIRAILDRTRDISTVTSDSPDGMKAELKAWTVWNSKIHSPKKTDAEAMLSVYSDVMVPRSHLQALGGTLSAINQAKNKIENVGGFLHPPSLADIYAMLEEDHNTFIVRSDDKKLLGYTSVLTKTELVAKRLSEMFGYDPSVITYRVGNVPTKNAQGKKVTWLSKKLAAEVLNSVPFLAESVEVAVLPNNTQEQLRTTGMATALKHAAYSKALEEGKTNVIVRHFEIIGVNSKEVPGGLMNAVSKRFILALGGEEIGSYEELFDALPNLHLKIRWHVYTCDLQKAVGQIEAFGK